MNYWKTLLIAGVVSMGASAAQASTIVVEGFDGLGGGDTSYENDGFLYDPAKKVNGQCLDGICLQEAEQSVITNITEEPVEGTYDFLGFYVNVNGKVSVGENLLSISNDSGDTLDLIVLDDLAASPFDDIITVYDEAGDVTNSFTFDSNGYFVAFKEDYTVFDNVTLVGLTSLSSASIRIDCVALAPVGGTGVSLDDTASQLTSCVGDVTTPPTPEVPLPAAGWLLLGGLGGLAALRRRKA